MRLEIHKIQRYCALFVLLQQLSSFDGIPTIFHDHSTIPSAFVIATAAAYIAPWKTTRFGLRLRSNTGTRQHTPNPMIPRNSNLLQRLFSSSTDTTTATPDQDNSSNSTNENPWMGNDMYQRIFYRFSRGSDVTYHDAIIIEERCRFVVDPQRPDYMIPQGPRTLLLRNGMGMDFDNGEIGDDFYTIHVATGTATTETSSSSSTHNGAGNDPAVQSAIACAIYLSCNPDICQGRMLEVSADTGLGSLLGCIGAGHVMKHNKGESGLDETSEDIVDDILTIGKDRKGPFPPELELLTITDVDETQLLKIMNNLKASGLKSGHKVNLDVLDWRTRKIQPRINRSPSSSSASSHEFRTVVASDIVFSYPETKELARAVAHRVEPITPYLFQTGPSTSRTTLPSFVHVCPDDRDDVTYLRRILEKGYRMSVSTKFLKLEKLIFHLQKIPSGQPESELEDMELELKDCKEIKYQALVAQHHPDYAGDGSGEWFFPIETGEYEATGGSTFLEKEAGSSPW